MRPGFLEAFADPTIAARTRHVLALTVLAGVLALVAPRLLPRSVATRTVLEPAARSGFAGLLVGLASRLVVQHHRSRWQMVALLGGMAGLAWLRHRDGEAVRPGIARWAAGSVGVCLGVVAAKWALEPGVLSDTLDQLRPAGGDR
ncbi:hypothetical protein P7D22_21525 [Lichenihabitans sp. Uapishka_5]|uniref:hypothetical protein n=1 Tax=Lichenihabitans sp. Uapishka_5 TaxID=3037302 RepID=UPI0029E7E994|nr:hypothetical protein [Lichenihabitans sp. Uapishka_5]MDX7953749.1 hypothetical protein [Lichenihabitans sp. Uapishka_5]